MIVIGAGAPAHPFDPLSAGDIVGAMSAALLSVFDPRPDELLRQLSKHVDNSMLEEIAAADYGSGFQENLAHLRRIQTECAFAVPMRWEPREVLELIRWSEPDIPTWRPGSHGERGHWMRAFACAALLRACGDFDNSELRVSWNQHVIQLIDSLRILGTRFYSPACSLLAWLLLHFEAGEKDEEELGFLAVGLLWLALSEPDLRISDDVIVSLAEWIIDREQSTPRAGPRSIGWLLETTLFDLRHAKWKRLGKMLEALGLRGRSRDAIERVKWIGSQLAGEGGS
jgi:hypothetical protein